jgi:hypothetical protein
MQIALVDMPYFAEIKDDIVHRVIVADNEQWCVENLGGEWVETFMDDPVEKYAGIGDVFQRDARKFEYPASKVIIPDLKPSEDRLWSWDEQSQVWEDVTK